MSLISDILLVAASVGLAVYCVVLSRRLSRFTDLEKGVGGAVAVLSAQVDDLTRALKSAQATAQESADALSSTTERAEDAARRLELHVAALHDLPPASGTPERANEAQASTEGKEESGSCTQQEAPDAETRSDAGEPVFAHSESGVTTDDARQPDDVARSQDGPEAGVAPSPSLFAAQRHIQPGVVA